MSDAHFGLLIHAGSDSEGGFRDMFIMDGFYLSNGKECRYAVLDQQPYSETADVRTKEVCLSVSISSGLRSGLRLHPPPFAG